MVEAAIVVPMLLLLLLSVLEFGSVYNDYSSLRQGTREGARQAAVATVPQPPSGTWASNGCQTTGIATTGDGYDLICFTKGRTGLNEANIRVSVEFTPQSAPSAPYLAGQGVVICTQYKSASVTGVLAPLLSNIILTSQTEIRIEQDSATFTAPVQETGFQSWAPSCNTP
jgi:Flp pilus assembly protein TadG